MVLGREVTGWPCGRQDTQPGSTRTPSPTVAVVAGEQLVFRAVNPHLPGRRRWQRHPQHQRARPCVILRGIQFDGLARLSSPIARNYLPLISAAGRNPRRRGVPPWDGRPVAASHEQKIRWLWGVTQPSRLLTWQCSRILAFIFCNLKTANIAGTQLD
jgi:hypothetical protein